MAIKSTYKPKIIGSVGDPNTGSGQVGAFRATGKGWFNKLPNFPAKESNANASMVNLAGSQKPKIYLFVNSIQTGWSLAGETAQGQMGRVFYPRNLTQDEVVIEGITANQYEYDRIVQFVEFHHRSQMLPQTVVPPNLYGDSSYAGVDFRLFKPLGGSPLDMFKPLRYLMLVTDIAAGAERFKNYPTFSLQCKVAYDYLGTNPEVDAQINKIVTRQQVFGNASAPKAFTTNNSPQQKPTPAQAKSAFNHRDTPQ